MVLLALKETYPSTLYKLYLFSPFFFLAVILSFLIRERRSFSHFHNILSGSRLYHFLCQTANVFDVFDSNRLYFCQEKIDLELPEIFAVRGTCAWERFLRHAFRNDRFKAGISSATKGKGSVDHRQFRSCGPKGKNDSGNTGSDQIGIRVVRLSLRVCTRACRAAFCISRRFTTEPIGSRCNRSE